MFRICKYSFCLLAFTTQSALLHSARLQDSFCCTKIFTQLTQESNILSLQVCLQDFAHLSGLQKIQLVPQNKTMLITASLVMLWWYSTRVKNKSPNTAKEEDTKQLQITRKTTNRQLEWHFTEGKCIIVHLSIRVIPDVWCLLSIIKCRKSKTDINLSIYENQSEM